MGHDLDPPYPSPDTLPPPPRRVSLPLWCHLLAGPLTVGASGFFAFGMVFVILFGSATDPLGLWRLSQRRQEARGLAHSEEATHFHEGGDDNDPGTTIYAYDYTFRLPDGTPRTGRSYHLGQFPGPRKEGQPFPATAVVVEYDPDHPETNRIQGMRTSPYTPAVLWVLLFPGVGLAAALGGLAAGRRRARLLRDGEFATATIQSCQFGAGENLADLTVDEYRQRLAALCASPVVQWVSVLGGGFIRLWTLMAMLIGVFGVVFCLVMLGIILILPMPPRDRLLFGLGGTAFFTVWVTMSLFFVRTGWQGCRALSRRGREGLPAPLVKCTFNFRLPDGQPMQAKAQARITNWQEAEPSQLAVYDPIQPSRALLLSGLEPALWIDRVGGWETTAGLGAVARLLVVFFLLLGPPVIWVVLL